MKFKPALTFHSLMSWLKTGLFSNIDPNDVTELTFQQPISLLNCELSISVHVDEATEYILLISVTRETSQQPIIVPNACPMLLVSPPFTLNSLMNAASCLGVVDAEIGFRCAPGTNSHSSLQIRIVGLLEGTSEGT